MLIRVKNSTLVKAREVLVIRSKLIINIAAVLKNEGFIDSFEECGETYMSEKFFVNKYVLINLKYKGIKQKSYITNIKRVSKPGFRVYVDYKSIPKVLGGVGIAVFA